MHRGSRVHYRNDSPRNAGTVTSIFHRNEGSFATVRWGIGWLTSYIKLADLVEIEPEAPAITETELMRASLMGSYR